MTATQNVAKLLDEARENTDIEIKLKNVINPEEAFIRASLIKLREMTWYVVSHGCSMEIPGIVGRMEAMWLKDEGVEVLSWEEYQDKCK